jgi:large subunit ribosomal protein L25
MSILRRTYQPLISLRRHLRPFSAAAAVAPAPSDPPSPFFDPLVPLDYLPGFPRPDPKYNEKIFSIPRAISGKNISGKLRKVGRVPAIVFEQANGQEGGNKKLISVEGKQIRKLVDHLGRSFFLSRLFELEVWSESGGSGELMEKVRVLPRLVSLIDHKSLFI